MLVFPRTERLVADLVLLLVSLAVVIAARRADRTAQGRERLLRRLTMAAVVVFVVGAAVYLNSGGR